MTWMSGSTAQHAFRLLLAGWYASCITGCLYVWPYGRDVVNQPPEILFQNPPGELIRIASESGRQVSVTAQDPEGDPLTPVWYVPTGVDYTEETTTDGVRYYFTLNLPKDELLNNEVVSINILDATNLVSTSWNVEVVQ